MKILMLSPFSPYPPNSGGRIRQWELIRYFGQRHDLTVVYNAFTKEEYGMQQSIKSSCANAIAVKNDQKHLSPELQKLPWPVRAFRTTEMLKTLEELQSFNFDAAIIEFVYMSHYHDLLPACTVLDEHNIESDIFRQYADIPNISEAQIFGLRKNRSFWKATWMLMAEFENKMWQSFPLRITVSDKDKQEMDRRCHLRTDYCDRKWSKHSHCRSASSRQLPQNIIYGDNGLLSQYRRSNLPCQVHHAVHPAKRPGCFPLYFRA